MAKNSLSPVEKYNSRARATDSLVCVGLDSEFDKLPEQFKALEFPQYEFNKWIIEETNEFVASYKANSAFYRARGEQGMSELKMTIEYLVKTHPDIFTILDSKWGDIGNTNRGYVEYVFDWLNFDAVTLHPYLGAEALEPFLSRKDKTSIILVKTSNPGSGEFQNVLLKTGVPLWQYVAKHIAETWNVEGNCMMVVGATYPADIKKVREIAGDITFLVPGVGAQGGNVKEAVRAGINSEGLGLIIHSARGVIFAENPKEEARKLRDEIRTAKN